MDNYMKLLFITIVCTLVVLPGNAWAYLDPGTGSMVLQSLTAIFFAVMAVLGVFWQRIKAFFSSSQRDEGKKTG